MVAIVNTTAYADPELVLDADGDPVSGLVTGDWTKSAYLVSNPATTATLTMTEVGSTGEYVPSFTPTSVGLWQLSYSVNVDGETARYGQVVQVIPAAADPSALATAIAAVQTILLGSEVTVTSPLATDGTIMLLQGDTYDSDETRAIVFSLTGQPDLTSATTTLLLSWGVDSLALTGVITNAGQTTQTITVELTAAQTATLPVTGITYALKATLANAHVVTMQTGRVIVSAALPAN